MGVVNGGWCVVRRLVEMLINYCRKVIFINEINVFNNLEWFFYSFCLI